MSSPLRFDPREIKARLPFADLCAHEAIGLRRSGPNEVGLCPFHQEKSGSFTVFTYAHDHSLDHAHCFGCGWNGDIFDFWRERHGGDFADALAPLASLASVSPSVFQAKRAAAQVPRMTSCAQTEREKPALPRMRALSNEEIVTLATLRGLTSEGIRAGAVAKRVGFCVWPQWEKREEFGSQEARKKAFRKSPHPGFLGSEFVLSAEAAPCWVVTDAERRVAQFRRLDGKPFVRRDGQEIKAWTKGSPTWPIGAAEIDGPPSREATARQRGAVLLVEGGADMLAAFHFLSGFGLLGKVAVCAMLGASCAIAEEALKFFARKRVRLMMHADPAGLESAGRWTNQLTEVGAAVESFSLEGLVRPASAKGSGASEREMVPVSDLNDLALCDESAWLEPDLRAAFFEWDF